MKPYVSIGPYLPFSDLDGVKHYVFIGLYLPFLNLDGVNR